MPLTRWALAGLLGVLLMFVASALEVRAAFLVQSFGALLVSATLYVLLRAAAPQLILPRVVWLAAFFPLPSLATLSLLDFPLTAPTDLPIDVLEHPRATTLPLLLVQISTLGATSLLAPRRWESARTIVGDVQPAALPAFQRYLAAAAAVMVLYWPATLPESGVVGYSLRILASSCFLMPYLAGRFTPPHSPYATYWVVMLIINGAFGLLTGGRLVALAPPGFYALGWLATKQGRARRSGILKLSGAFVAAVLVSGIAGMVRGDIGRGGWEVVTQRRVSDYATSVRQQLSDDGTSSPLLLAIEQGISRLVPWTTVIVPISSPALIPYRGYAGIWVEAQASASIAAVAGRSRMDLFDDGLATIPATRYGFMVDDQTSVEWGLLPDAWSRGGPAAVVLFTLVLTLVICLVERLLRRVQRNYQVASVMVLMTMARVTFDMTSQPLISQLRQVVLLGGGMAVLMFAIEAFRKRSAHAR